MLAYLRFWNQVHIHEPKWMHANFSSGGGCNGFWWAYKRVRFLRSFQVSPVRPSSVFFGSSWSNSTKLYPSQTILVLKWDWIKYGWQSLPQANPLDNEIQREWVPLTELDPEFRVSINPEIWVDLWGTKESAKKRPFQNTSVGELPFLTLNLRFDTARSYTL